MKKKLYVEQFRECYEDGYVMKGPFQSFKKHPELLPLPVHKELNEAISSGKLRGFYKNLCLRFGGDCHSQNHGCMKMRNIT